MRKKADVLIFVILILVLVLVLLIGGYFLYLNAPGEPELLTPNTRGVLQTENLSSEVSQFYSNMKFNHNQISYKIDSACSAEKTSRMTEAFSQLSEKVGIISFIISETPDIEVSCSEDKKHSVNEDYFIAGEGGAKEIIQTERYNVITNGVILLYGNPEAIFCKWPNVELHELLHVFGFDHSKDSNSLMYPLLQSCEQKLDESIIADLKNLYSQPNLADLYFQNAIFIKKGRYLDFNITVKNSGDVNAQQVYITVFDEGKKVQDFDLKEIKFGAGVSFQVSNLKLLNRDSKEIKLIIDSDDLISEIDEENNAASWEISQ